MKTDVLFQKLTLGDLEIPNRIIMSPLTRQRAGATRVPNDLMATYYSQRASAGLIVSEATSVEPMGVGYKDTPGIWNDDQVQGWRKVTSAVHERGGRMFLQLWHVGRISHPLFLGGETPVAPSSVQPKGHVSLVRPEIPYPAPRALETREVKAVVASFRAGAVRARQAEFDGVEIHAANGYLIDQFLQSSTNHREDEYGGTIENRARFLFEIVDEVISVWGAGRVGVHLAPAADAHDMGDASPVETFGYVARELGRRKVAFLFIREPQRPEYLTPRLKREFGGVVVANQSLTPDQAAGLIQEGVADAAAWGKFFISNPDLVDRIRRDAPFANFDSRTFYEGGDRGYTDYPTRLGDEMWRSAGKGGPILCP